MNQEVTSQSGYLRKVLNRPILTVENIAILILIASILFFTFYARLAISSELAYINVPFYMALILLINKVGCRFDLLGLALCIVASVIFLVIEISVGTSGQDIIKFFVLYCLPLYICQLTLAPCKRNRTDLAATIIQFINFFTFFVFGILIVDCLSGSAIMKALTSEFMTDMIPWVSSGIFERHASIWGHYLCTAGFYLVFYYVNMTYYKMTNIYLISPMVLNTVATLGILSTGGKTALVVYLVSLVWLNITGKHAIRNSLALTIFLLFLYFIGAFDIVLERFGAEDLSSGRNDSTVEVFSQELPRFFKGYGENYMAHMTATIDYGVVAMFSEYSLLALSYKFGIVFVILMIVLLLRRSFIVAREKSKPSIVFMSVMMVLYFSTFNGMVGVPDVYLIMALYIVVLPLYTTMGNDDKSILRKTRHSRNDYPTSCTDYA